MARVATELGLKPGKDFHMVGWTLEEACKDFYLPAVVDGYVLPALTWSVKAMAETAMSRLAGRQEHADLPAVRIKIPVKLRSIECCRSFAQSLHQDGKM